MANGLRGHVTLAIREGDDGNLCVTWGRLDLATNRMVFEHVADLLGPLGSRLDAAGLMVQAAGLHYRMREQEALINRG